jgi:hypothetical protein
MWKSTVAGIAISPTLSSFVINIVVLLEAESKYYLLFVLIQIDNRRYFNDFSIKTTRQFSYVIYYLFFVV